MPQAGTASTTSGRRAIIAGGATFAGTFGALAALPDDRDDRLLGLLAEYDRLEAELLALGRSFATIADEEAHQDVCDALEARQIALAPLIVAAPTHTLAGLRARARNLAGWAPDLLVPDADKGWDQRFVAATLRDLARHTG